MNTQIAPLRIVLVLGLVLAFCAGSMLAVADNARVERAIRTYEIGRAVE